MPEYYVYIMSNDSRMLYVGVTNNLETRVFQHKEKAVPGYTSRYNMTRLVYFESGSDILGAITREKQLKGWVRSKKVALIEAMNPRWDDLSVGWFREETKTLPFRSATGQGDKEEGGCADDKQGVQHMSVMPSTPRSPVSSRQPASCRLSS